MSARRASWRIVESANVAAIPWRNGGGVTRELLVLPGDAAAGDASRDDWMLRISAADVAADGPFSRFPGVERWFAVLAGAGVTLEWGAAPESSRETVTPASAALRFDGDTAPACRLLDGPTRDLNVMVRRELAQARVDRAQWNVAWHAEDAAAWRSGAAALGAGLFACVPLLLQAGAGPARLLPAETLAWCEHPDPSAWTIVPVGVGRAPHAQTGSAGAPPGWWIALSPVRLPAC